MTEAPCPGNSCFDDSADAGGVHTAIFVDVDGVLNVGIRDGDCAPLILSQANMDNALVRRSLSEQECAEKILSVSKRRLGRGERGTFASMASHAPSGLCEAFLTRLARLIRAAGSRRTVVLASSWRHPRHKLRVRCLEQDISRYMGERFSFDGRTRLCDENGAEDRLSCIGETAARIAASCRGPLRVLILEDFFTTPLRGWACGSTKIESLKDVERYVLDSCGSSESVAVKVVHTYDEWKTPRGLLVQVGAGLTMDHYKAALDFVRGRSRPLGAEPATALPAADDDLGGVLKTDSLKDRFAKSLLQVLVGGQALPLFGLRESSRKLLEWLKGSLPFFSWPPSRNVES